MQKKYIDIGPVILNVQRNLMPNVDEAGMVFVNDAERWFISLLKKAPEANVKEIKSSQWIIESEQSIRCPECCFNRASIKMPLDYCPMCGTYMGGNK